MNEQTRTLSEIPVSQLCKETETCFSSIQKAWKTYDKETEKTAYLYLAEADGIDNGLGFEVPTYFQIVLDDFEETGFGEWEVREEPFESLESAFDYLDCLDD